MVVYKRALADDTSAEFIEVDGAKWVEVFRTEARALPEFLLESDGELIVEASGGSRWRMRRATDVA